MRIRIIDDGKRDYPVVVNADTGEKIEGVLGIEYSATAEGRVATIRIIPELELVAEFREKT